MEVWILFQGPGRLDKSWPLLPWPETGQGLGSRWSGRGCVEADKDVDVGLWRLLLWCGCSLWIYDDQFVGIVKDGQ